MKSTVLLITLLMLSSSIPALEGSLQWWRGIEIYDIYLPSYMDSNEDGIGDLKGLSSKLSYIKELGIKNIKLSTIFQTAELNTHREGVTNYKEINPVFGTMKDFQQLVWEAAKKGIKIILDLPINHCHITHEWFQKSQNSIKPYANYFVWERGSKSTTPPSPPNNWLDKNNESAWTYDDTRRKFYYHWYDASLPDLNLKNRRVKQEIQEIMNFWLNKGVAGFNLLAAQAYVESHFSQSPGTFDNLQEDQPGTFRFLGKLRKFVDEFSDSRWDFERILIVEDRSVENITMKYFGDKASPLVHIISNRDFVSKIDTAMTSKELDDLIQFTVSQIQQGRSFEWVTEYSNMTRLARRFSNKEFTNTVLSIVAMLPGIMRIYYGQEIGMSEPYLRLMDLTNPAISTWNSHALPMQWNNSPNAGFTNKTESYAIPNSDYWNVNVEQQQQDSHSQYHFIKNLLKLRKKDIIKYGNFKSYIISTKLYAFTRSLSERETYLILINLSNEPQIIVDLRSVLANLPRKLHVVAASPNSVNQKACKIDVLSSLVLRPLSSIVIAFADKQKLETE